MCLWQGITLMFALAMLLALGLDLVIGWPKPLFDRIGHPVTWIGRAITSLEVRLNHGSGPNRRRTGAAMALVVIVTTGVLAGLVQSLLPGGVLGVGLLAVLAWPFLAARSLADHVRAVAQPLAAGNLKEARGEVAKIVGRDPHQLDEAGIARASIESLAENASDGVIAPLFWGVLAGLPGIAAYKAVNTLDSMIGHRSERYIDFGRFSARIDDLANWIPARLTGALIALVSGKREAWRAMSSEAHLHRSPNAGWPEAAMAGGINVRLSGPRVYDDSVSEEPWVNGVAPDPGAGDIGRGLGLFWRAVALTAACLLLLAWGM